jgi:hypothetical protein
MRRKKLSIDLDMGKQPLAVALVVSVFWLNPGDSDTRSYFDYEGLAQYLMNAGADVRMRSGADSAQIEAEVRERVFGWASYNF